MEPAPQLKLSYAPPVAGDPRRRRWGIASMVVGLLSALLTLVGMGLVTWRFRAARALAANSTTALLYHNPARLEQPSAWRFGLVCALLLGALLLAARLLLLAWRLLDQRLSLPPLRAWGVWRIILSLLIPIPAMLLGQNIHIIFEQRTKLGDLVDTRLLIGGGLTALAWVEILFPLFILRCIRRAE